jgi:peptide-methionine (R)-S-oxide reductase
LAAARPGASGGPAASQGAFSAGGAGDELLHEITRAEAEWRARLSNEEYHILRERGTELPETSALWNVFDDGRYYCRGCDLPLFSSVWKRDVNLGWNFFRHAEPDSVLNGIDGPVAAYGQSMGGRDTMIEVHCRRCGSHLGHLLRVRRDLLFCINGRALTFTPVPV